MRLLCALAVLCGIAQAQVFPKVDPPAAVDVNVSSLSWHQYGEALMYEKADGNGKSVGLYALGSKEGFTVLRLASSDRYEAQWFPNQSLITFIVYRDFGAGDEARIEASVYLADAATGQSSKLWSEAFPAKDGVRVKVDPSPKLRHAIYRVMAGKQTYSLVLPNNGSRLVRSQDLEQAEREGFSGPTWSVDGTAIYMPDQRENISEGAKLAKAEADLEKAYLSSKIQEQAIKKDLAITTVKLWIRHPTPEVGAAVFELMPANAALRQVRFKGEWRFQKPRQEPYTLTTKQILMQMGEGSTIAHSLWLTTEKDRDNGVPLAAHAEKSWLAPWNLGVAYITDGALFVRTFRRNN